MLIKEFGILMVLCYGIVKMPFQGINNPVKQGKMVLQKHQSLKSIMMDTVKKQNTVYVEALKYTHDVNSGKFAQITIKNTTKQIITDISFRLDGDVAKGCNKAYNIKKKIKLKPNQSITIFQRLAKDDCEVHEIKDIRIKYTMNINFTLD